MPAIEGTNKTAVNDLSQIAHAEIRLAELGIKDLIEQEVDLSLKFAIALGFLFERGNLWGKCGSYWSLCSARSSLGSLCHIVAAISGVAGVGMFLLGETPP
jgi:hypothetical protein